MRVSNRGREQMGGREWRVRRERRVRGDSLSRYAHTPFSLPSFFRGMRLRTHPLPADRERER
jgi:hypothetical protein